MSLTEKVTILSNQLGIHNSFSLQVFFKGENTKIHLYIETMKPETLKMSLSLATFHIGVLGLSPGSAFLAYRYCVS